MTVRIRLLLVAIVSLSVLAVGMVIHRAVAAPDGYTQALGIALPNVTFSQVLEFVGVLAALAHTVERVIASFHARKVVEAARTVSLQKVASYVLDIAEAAGGTDEQRWVLARSKIPDAAAALGIDFTISDLDEIHHLYDLLRAARKSTAVLTSVSSR